MHRCLNGYRVIEHKNVTIRWNWTSIGITTVAWRSHGCVPFRKKKKKKRRYSRQFTPRERILPAHHLMPSYCATALIKCHVGNSRWPFDSIFCFQVPSKDFNLKMLWNLPVALSRRKKTRTSELYFVLQPSLLPSVSRKLITDYWKLCYNNVWRYRGIGRSGPRSTKESYYLSYHYLTSACSRRKSLSSSHYLLNTLFSYVPVKTFQR